MNDYIQGSYSGAQAGIQDRISFVRSVYLWLMAGIAVAGLGAITSPIMVRAISAIAGRYFMLVLALIQFGALIWAQSVSRRSPLNRIAFGVYTFLSGTIAGLFALAIGQAAGYGIVLAAFGMTLGGFLALTITALVTRKDFSFLSSFVLIGLVVAVIGSIVGIFLRLPALDILISVIVVLACSAKILWDTSAMLRTRDTNDAAGFALSLFISLYLIFIHLLNLLGGRRN